MNDESGNNGTIRIQQADSVVLLINAQTAYQLKSSVFTASPENKFTGNEHPHRAVSQCIQKAADKGYEVLCKEHIADYQSSLSRVTCVFVMRLPVYRLTACCTTIREEKKVYIWMNYCSSTDVIY